MRDLGLFLERACSPERPQNQQGLKEQTGEPGSVSVEAEGVGVGEVLRDVSREDGDKERSGDPTHLASIPPGDQERHPESDFHDTRSQHDEISVERQPGGNLGLKFFPPKGEVTQSGEE